MPRTGSSASVFGGAGGRGTRASVATLDGLRNVMRNEPSEKAIAPRSAAPTRAAAPPAVPVGPADDKKTMRGLNERLSGYLGRVRELEKSNKELEDQIKGILAKRAVPGGRDWDETEKPLDHLRKKLKEKTMENAKLLLQIDNAKLANDDFRNKLDAEKDARHAVEQDLVGLKKIIDDTRLNRSQLENQIESVKDELNLIKKDHNDDVEDLRKRIRDSEVIVEMDSQDSNLGETLNNIRGQYEKLANKNKAEAENWYKDKFDNIKVEVRQNTETLQTGHSERSDLLRQKQQAEIDVQAMISMIHSLEETQQETENRYNHELNRLNQILLGLEEQLGKVRSQVAKQVDDYQELVHVKMKLEAEIESYRSLIHGITADEDSLEFSLGDALQSAKNTKKSKGAAPAKEKEMKEEALMKPQSVKSNQAAPPQLGAADPAKELKAANNGPPGEKAPKTKKDKTKKEGSSSSSSSDSESEQKDK